MTSLPGPSTLAATSGTVSPDIHPGNRFDALRPALCRQQRDGELDGSGCLASVSRSRSDCTPSIGGQSHPLPPGEHNTAFSSSTPPSSKTFPAEEGGVGKYRESVVGHTHDGGSITEEHRQSQREKQVSYGFVTDGYKNMIRIMERDPLLKSGGVLPLAPPPAGTGSKRTWELHLRKWRRALHMFDHVFVDGEDPESERPRILEAQRQRWVSATFSEQPRELRVRHSMDTLIAARYSPMVPTKIPVEEDLKRILRHECCYEPVTNVVPQTASSLTRGNSICPTAAGIKIHIVPSAAVLEKQRDQRLSRIQLLQQWHASRSSNQDPSGGVAASPQLCQAASVHPFPAARSSDEVASSFAQGLSHTSESLSPTYPGTRVRSHNVGSMEAVLQGTPATVMKGSRPRASSPSPTPVSPSRAKDLPRVPAPGPDVPFLTAPYPFAVTPSCVPGCGEVGSAAGTQPAAIPPGHVLCYVPVIIPSPGGYLPGASFHSPGQIPWQDGCAPTMFTPSPASSGVSPSLAPVTACGMPTTSPGCSPYGMTSFSSSVPRLPFGSLPPYSYPQLTPAFGVPGDNGTSRAQRRRTPSTVPRYVTMLAPTPREEKANDKHGLGVDSHGAEDHIDTVTASVGQRTANVAAVAEAVNSPKRALFTVSEETVATGCVGDSFRHVPSDSTEGALKERCYESGKPAKVHQTFGDLQEPASC